MSEQILNQGSMYESIQGIQELNQVEGFDPRKYMRQLAGLGGKVYRSGDYDYYINETVRNNDPKAVGPFILASLEWERLQDVKATVNQK